MLNREYQLRAVRKAGGGHKVAADAALRLPWAGIFEPWRPYVLVAAAAESISSPRAAKAGRCKKGRSRQRQLFDGKLRGIQLDLFPDNGAENFTAAEKFTAGGKSMATEKSTPPGLLPAEFPSPASVEVPLSDDDRPLFDLFPEAYQ
jgi:hypothetical protein